ncbi:MAG: diguanylate cyclase, partial [Clostridia bacterium]|nr:diguanylate cyclase [Clostridia bacterium]
KLISHNEDNSATPIMVLTSDVSPTHELAILEEEIEYCIKKPVSNKALYYMIKNMVNLISTNRGISPLTKLPGNIPIQAELKKRLLKNEEFAVLYLDLDNFKPYNDTYGFLGGDEVIKQTARIIVSQVNASENIHNFVRTYRWR